MAFFEVKDGGLRSLEPVSLSSVGIYERRDLQKYLRDHVGKLLPDVLVIAEEFGNWEDSKRRIDLLGVDQKGRLVVIELKRGDTGVHMELQAIRYAAMVSTMTFEQAVEAFSAYANGAFDARARLMQHLGWSEVLEDEFAQEVRIVLISEDFSKELTSSVLWLREFGLAIVCYRMAAYKVEDRLFFEFQQIIPLPEAEDYQIKLRNKEQTEQESKRATVDWNGEYYANYGDLTHRSWEDARKYGFISAGGGAWFTRTLSLLQPGGRVWVNSPGVGYLGVGIVEGAPASANQFMVDTPDGKRRYLEVGNVSPSLKDCADDPERTEFFVPVRWLKTVPAEKAVKLPGLFGNQNSAAKPKSADWPQTVEKLKVAFGISD